MLIMTKPAMLIILLFVFVATNNVSAVTNSYNAHCPSGSTVRVHAPGVSVFSKYKTYKDLVCAACSVTDCKETRLFEGDKKKYDRHMIVRTSNLEKLTLKNHGTDEIEVSYKCPGGGGGGGGGGEAAHTVRCHTSSTMKACLTAQCDDCTSAENCEVYVGTKKVSSGKVAVSRGVYQVDTKTSKIEKVKESMAKIKKLATSDKVKGLASAVGAAVINNREKILRLAEVIGLCGERVKNVEQIIRMGDAFYTKDVNGGLAALVELTGRSLSQEEERLIEKDMEDGEIDYAKLLHFIKLEREDIATGKELQHDHEQSSGGAFWEDDDDWDNDDFWEDYWMYMIVGAAVVSLSSTLCCLSCLCLLVTLKCTRKAIKKGAVSPYALEVML